MASQLVIAEAGGQGTDAFALGPGQLAGGGVGIVATQGGVQHLAAFGGVGDAAAQHELSRLGQAGTVGHADQGVDDGAVDALFAEVGDQTGGLEPQLGRPVGVVEQAAQRGAFDPASLALQDAPGRPPCAGGGGVV